MLITRVVVPYATVIGAAARVTAPLSITEVMLRPVDGINPLSQQSFYRF
ncbi:MAG: hypothetical protein L0K46_10955 [Yaniella sp.]|nr:hypothetical protein [Yaniella sp.]